MRIGSANLLHGLDVQTRRVDLSAAARAIAALDADVVAVQEVDRDLSRTGGVDQLHELGARLGMVAVFAPALLGDPDARWSGVGRGDPGGPAYGVGILSRLRVMGTERTVLPGGGDGHRGPTTPAAAPREGIGRPTSPNPGWDHEPRAALTAVLDAGAPLRVTCTHLSYLPWRALRQLRAAARVAQGQEAGPAVLVGDLNLPVWPVRLLLRRRWTHAGGAPTYPAWAPRLQVDQIAVTGGVAVRGVRVLPPGPSDHRALVADLAVPVG